MIVCSRADCSLALAVIYGSINVSIKTIVVHFIRFTALRKLLLLRFKLADGIGLPEVNCGSEIFQELRLVKYRTSSSRWAGTV